MSKKFILSLVVLSLLGISSYAFAGAYTFQNDWHNTANDAGMIGAHGTLTEDWFEPNNWGQQTSTQYNPKGARRAPPDWAVAAAMEPKTPDPCVCTQSPYYATYGPEAQCSLLGINPWSWTGAPVSHMTIADCNINCGAQIMVCTWTSFSSDAFNIGVLDVNGGTMYTPGFNNFDINFPDDPTKHDDPNYTYIMGGGLGVGGGSNEPGGPGANRGIVNIRNDGKIIVPRVVVNYGDINILGSNGLLYMTSPNDVNLYISLAHQTNRINVAGGTLKTDGDLRDRVNYYVGKGKIVGYANRGMLTVAYDAEANTTSVTAIGDNGNAWNPIPTHQKVNVNLNPTLTWSSGDFVKEGHQVYFGTDATQVNDATTADTGIYKGLQTGNSYPVTGLSADTMYYWRVDEVNTDEGSGGPWKGWVWNFRTLGGSAVDPIPASGIIGLPVECKLDWLAGAFADSHRLYISTSEANTTDATAASAAGLGVTLINPAVKPYLLGSLSWDLAKDTTYYWRIDEVRTGDGQTWKGETWNFTNTSYLVIDDFNSYASSEDMNTKWATNFSNSCGDTSQAGLTLINSDNMQLVYTNNASIFYSEARFIANGGSGADWTGGGALPSGDPLVNLAISYLGASGNSANPTYDRMYMAVEDAAGRLSVVTNNPDPNATRDIFGWSEWSIGLPSFTRASGPAGNIDWANIKYLYLGVGQRCNYSYAGGTGTVQFDDLRLYQRHCVADYNKPVGDLTNDCRVSMDDLDYMVNNWLATDDSRTLTVSAPATGPTLWYKFNDGGGPLAYDELHPEANNASVLNPTDDSVLWSSNGGFDGQGCLNLVVNSNTLVDIPPTTLNFLSTKNAFTMMLWIKMDYYSPTNEWPRLISVWEPNLGAIDTEIVEIECPTTRPPSNTAGPTVRARLTQADSNVSDDNQTSQMSTLDFANQWNHYAFVKDKGSNVMKIYHNGFLVLDKTNATAPIPTPPLTGFRLGCRLDNQYEQHWVGSIDDFRVYDYALSAAQVAYVGTKGTGNYSHPMADAPAVANIYNSDSPQTINFRDYATMAKNWLSTAQWP